MRRLAAEPRACCLVAQVRVKVVARRLHASVQRRERADVLNREVETVAGEHAVLQHIAAMDGLEAVEDRLVEEVILRHARIFPIDARLPAEAAAEDREQADDVEDAERTRADGIPHGPREPRDKGKLRPVPPHDERDRHFPKHEGHEERDREPHGQVKFLHERPKERHHVVVRRIEHQLIEIRMKLAVIREARDVKDRRDEELRAERELPPRVLDFGNEVVQHERRRERERRHRARRLARQPRAAHDGRKDVRRARPGAHVVSHPPEEEQTANEKDCKAEAPCLQSFSQFFVKRLPGKPAGAPHGRMISTP